mgnify:CR=1 FL=1
MVDRRSKRREGQGREVVGRQLSSKDLYMGGEGGRAG